MLGIVFSYGPGLSIGLPEVRRVKGSCGGVIEDLHVPKRMQTTDS